MSESRPIRLFNLYTDGACEPTNPGGYATYAWVLYDNESSVAVARGVGCLGRWPASSNNIAEYAALRAGLEALMIIRPAGGEAMAVCVRTDSLLVVNHVLGAWRCTKPHLAKMLEQVRRVFIALTGITEPALLPIEHVPRERNVAADTLSRKALESARVRKMNNNGRDVIFDGYEILRPDMIDAAHWQVNYGRDTLQDARADASGIR